MPFWWKIVIGGLAVGVLFIAAVNAFVILSFAQIPIELHARVTNSPVHRGDDVIVAYSGERNRLCRVDSDQFLIDQKTKLLVLRERLPAGWNPVGPVVGEIALSTKELKPGDYLLRVFLHSDCGYRLFTDEVPEVVFTVVE